MPSIREQSTVDAIATAFCSNDRCQEKAMVEVGYSKAYARSYCGKLWADKRLISAIAKIDAKGAKRLEVTVDSLALKYEETYEFAKKCNQPAAMNGAITGTARLFALDQDTQSDSQARELTEAEKIEANEYAIFKLNRPKREVG